MPYPHHPYTHTHSSIELSLLSGHCKGHCIYLILPLRQNHPLYIMLALDPPVPVSNLIYIQLVY
jgi:hypothetical protein